MHAEELVQKWINEKRTSISENEIKEYGYIGKMAILILENNYEGKYFPPNSSYSCGGYSFKNPLGHYEKVYGLYYMFPKQKLEKLGNFFTRYYAIREIVRLEYDDIYWHLKEQIPYYIEKIDKEFINDMYFKTRYWFIWEEEIWVV